MATRKQKTKVGIFLTVCSVLIVGSIVRLMGIYEVPSKDYWIEFGESVLGLYEGGLVEYLGVPVGKVRGITVAAKNMMRGEIAIATPPPDWAPAAPGPKEASDHQLTLGNTGDEDFHIISASSPEAFSGPAGTPNPMLTLIPGKRYAITVADSKAHPFQLVAMAPNADDDVVLLAQGGGAGLLEGDPNVNWYDDGREKQGTVIFSMTQKLINALNGSQRRPGYRAPVQVFRAHVDLAIDPGVTFHEGVQAQIVIYSFAAGTMAISLEGGDAQAPELPPGSQIPTRPSIVSAISTRIETLMANLTAITDQVKSGMEGLDPGEIAAMVTRVNTLLDEGEGFIRDGRAMLDSTTDTITSVRDDAKRLVDEAIKVAGDVHEITSNVNGLVTTATAKVDEIDPKATEAQLNKALAEMTKVAESLNRTIAKFDELSANMMHEGNNIEYAIRNALSQVAEAFDALRNLVQQVKDDPASLLRGPGTPKEAE